MADTDDTLKAFRVRRSALLGLKLMHGSSPKRFWGLAAASVVEGLVPTLFAVSTGLFVGAIPDAVQSGSLTSPEGQKLLWLLGLVGFLFSASGVFGDFMDAHRDGFRALVSAHRRERVMRATLAVPGIRHLEDPDYLDALRLATTRDWPDPGSFATGVYGLLTNRVTSLTSAVVIGVQFNWLVAIALVIAWGVVGFYLRKGQAEGFAAGKSDLRRSTYFRDLAFNPDAAKETRIFSLDPWVLEHFSKSWRSVMEVVWKFRSGQNVQRVFMLGIVLLISCGSAALLVRAVANGEIGIGALTAVGQAMMSVSMLALMDENTMSVSLGASAFPSIEDLEEQSKNDALTMSGQKDAGGLPVQEIVFEDVSFSYPGNPDVLIYDHLNLRIAAGTSLGIVGSNGAGKTTLIKLLARLYDPTGGRILVDGVDLKELDPRSWQRRVAAIFQDFIKFPYTAGDNVGFGNIEHRNDADTLARAVELVGAAEIIDGLPNKWDTVLSRQFEGGADISGGQWQRIALARALFAVQKGAGVLVLDEPTANLDARSEVLLFDRFLDVTRGSTALLISHRFSTVRRADRIVVIEQGKVVEEGTHQELIARNGRYAHSFQLQAERYEQSESEEAQQ